MDISQRMKLAERLDGEAFVKALRNVSEPLLRKEEAELRAMAKPTKIEFALRMALWNELRRAEGGHGKVKPARVYSGICTSSHWYSHVLKSPEKVAWLLQPPEEHDKDQGPVLASAVERYHELLNLGEDEAEGRPLPNLPRVLLDTMKLLEAWLRGYNAGRADAKGAVEGTSPARPMLTVEEIKREIIELENKLGLPPGERYSTKW